MAILCCSLLLAYFAGLRQPIGAERVLREVLFWLLYPLITLLTIECFRYFLLDTVFRSLITCPLLLWSHGAQPPSSLD